MSITQEQIAAEYPIPSYRFMVSIGDVQVPFNSVSGLDRKYEVIEYKDGIGNYYKMPGQIQRVDITLRKGIFSGKNDLFNWINSIELNRVEKKDITISLTNDTGSKVLMSWVVSNAFPSSLTAPSFDASSNEIAVQEISLVADRVTIQVP